MRRVVLPLAVLALLLALAGHGLAGSTSYVAATGDVAYVCTLRPATGTCVGGASFSVPTWANGADVAVEDAVTDPTGGFYEVDDPDGDALDSARFCGSASVPLPTDAATLNVYVDTLPRPGPCEDVADVGTAGEIQVTWT